LARRFVSPSSEPMTAKTLDGPEVLADFWRGGIG
jgi:hypothetical protein